jgi:hypothetical protein
MNKAPLNPFAGTQVTTYVVAGHPRTGTSMMMHALVAGGLEAAYSKSWDEQDRNANGYIQNPNGFYELSPEDQSHPWFPAANWGKLIKVQYPQLCGFAPGRYRVVFTMRHPREIRMSYRAMGKASAEKTLQWSREENYEPLMKRYMAAASMRVDMQLLEVWYSEVLTDALAVFERIREFGFPIDPERAASTIDPALYRNRFESQEAESGSPP